MIEKIIEYIFPTCCGVCGKIYKKWICPKCYYNLKNELKYEKHKEDKFYLYYISSYENSIRKLLLKYKFKECAYLANTFVEILSKNKKIVQEIEKYDYIIPVPMHNINKSIRGYNQTEILAKKIKRRFGIMYKTDILLKIRQNKRQSELNEKQRIENVKNIYKLQNESILENKKILLLDDIYTTGSTIKACIKELEKSNPKKIDALVVAKRN